MNALKYSDIILKIFVCLCNFSVNSWFGLRVKNLNKLTKFKYVKMKLLLIGIYWVPKKILSASGGNCRDQSAPNSKKKNLYCRIKAE